MANEKKISPENRKILSCEQLTTPVISLQQHIKQMHLIRSSFPAEDRNQQYTAWFKHITENQAEPEVEFWLAEIQKKNARNASERQRKHAVAQKFRIAQKKEEYRQAKIEAEEKLRLSETKINTGLKIIRLTGFLGLVGAVIIFPSLPSEEFGVNKIHENLEMSLGIYGGVMGGLLLIGLLMHYFSQPIHNIGMDWESAKIWAEQHGMSSDDSEVLAVRLKMFSHKLGRQ